MYTKHVLLILLLMISTSFSQLSVQLSTKDIISYDVGASFLKDNPQPYFELLSFDSTDSKLNVSFGNSLGLFSNDIFLGLAWGKDKGHLGAYYTSLYTLYGYNWYDFLYFDTGLYWGIGFRKTFYVFSAKLEFQRIHQKNQNILVLEIGAGL